MVDIEKLQVEYDDLTEEIRRLRAERLQLLKTGSDLMVRRSKLGIALKTLNNPNTRRVLESLPEIQEAIGDQV